MARLQIHGYEKKVLLDAGWGSSTLHNFGKRVPHLKVPRESSVGEHQSPGQRISQIWIYWISISGGKPSKKCTVNSRRALRAWFNASRGLQKHMKHLYHQASCGKRSKKSQDVFGSQWRALSAPTQIGLKMLLSLKVIHVLFKYIKMATPQLFKNTQVLIFFVLLISIITISKRTNWKKHTVFGLAPYLSDQLCKALNYFFFHTNELLW